MQMPTVSMSATHDMNKRIHSSVVVGSDSMQLESCSANLVSASHSVLDSSLHSVAHTCEPMNWPSHAESRIRILSHGTHYMICVAACW